MHLHPIFCSNYPLLLPHHLARTTSNGICSLKFLSFPFAKINIFPIIFHGVIFLLYHSEHFLLSSTHCLTLDSALTGTYGRNFHSFLFICLNDYHSIFCESRSSINIGVVRLAMICTGHTKVLTLHHKNLQCALHVFRTVSGKPSSLHYSLLFCTNLCLREGHQKACRKYRSWFCSLLFHSSE